MKILIHSFLTFISFPILSRIWGVITKIKHPQFIIQRIIKIYAKHYAIDMNNYKGSFKDYSSLASFFIRPLNENVRPLKKKEKYFLSPADGIITEWEKLTENYTTQVKGTKYNISDFIKQQIDIEQGWHIITIYLSPKDYHRFHTPVTAPVSAIQHTGGRLYPVNRLSVHNVSDLFIKNERVIVKFDYKTQPFYYVAVGATFVGSIKIDCNYDDVSDIWVSNKKSFEQLQEFGRFEMGSTIVLVVPDSMVKKSTPRKGQPVQVGDVLFEIQDKEDA